MKYSNRFNLPTSFVDAVTKNTYDLTQNNPNVISVTSLNNPPKMFQLSRRHWVDLEEDVSDNIWRLLGSAVHEVLARIHEDGRLIEKRIYLDLTTNKIIHVLDDEKLQPEVGHIYISGKPDLYDMVEEALEDYKVTSVWAVKFDKVEWVNQVNLYSYLLRKSGYPVTKGFINAILRDWSAAQSKKSDDYPPIAYKKIEIPIWTIEEQEQHIKERIEFHKKYMDTPDDEIPPCSEEERWKNDIRCQSYCSSNKFCNYWRDRYVAKISN